MTGNLERCPGSGATVELERDHRSARCTECGMLVAAPDRRLVEHMRIEPGTETKWEGRWNR